MGSKKLSVAAVKTLAMANFDHGGDYLLEMLSDAEIAANFCGTENGRTELNNYMRKVEQMRKSFSQYKYV